MDYLPPPRLDPPAMVQKLSPPQLDYAGDAAPTPQAEVERVLSLLPTPKIGFVDYGCGDARWCIAAAKRWGCKVTGVEIDPARAAAAKERVRAAGMERLVTIIEGDAITTTVDADVGVAYLWPDVLGKLRPRIEKLTAFASYQHQPPGVPVSQNGESWFYTRPQPVAAAAWGGRTYTGPLCNSPNCAMCQSIRSQLASQQPATAAPSGHFETRKFCNGRTCWYADVWVPD